MSSNNDVPQVLKSDLKNSLKSGFRRIIKFLASLKLAVVVLAALACVIAVGTLIESKYDATAARKWVYETFWMYTVMSFLAINLVAVMVDRWPWKPRHAPFVFAHIGILILMAGALLTQKFGLDGNVRVGIGESNQYVTVPETDILVYTSFDGDRYTKLAEKNVDFFSDPPSPQKPLVVTGYHSDIKFTGYKPYVLPSRKVVAPKEANGRHGSALRFQIQNENIKVNVVDWLVQRRANELVTYDFGPARLHLGPAPQQGQGANEIYFTPDLAKGGLKYVVFKKDSEKPLKSGFVKEGEVFAPGWKMPMEVRALRYLPEAEEEWDLEERKAPTPLTTSAVKLEFNGQDHWLLMNDTLKLFTQEVVYIVSYGNRRLDLGFPLKLRKFEIGRYQGTAKAMAYKSIVEVPGVATPQEISMNEPLKYKGFTFYQASFQEDPKTQEPNASIFSVNQDPGRWIKYLGCFITVIGIIMLFYFKKKAKRGSPA
ncbi:MAG: cytochrome c biogenesis protein ResB [Pseudobdellovibrionaceae bacterium]